MTAATRGVCSGTVKRKHVVLISVPHYLPGHKAGGPIRTIANMVEALGDEFDFRIITSDRDLKDQAVYPEVSLDKWNQVGKGWVWYLPASQHAMITWWRLLRETPHDLLYLNSLFHPRFSLSPLIIATIRGGAPILLAPRGELAPGALSLKGWKKSIFLRVANVVGLYRNVRWHASTEGEAELIRTQFGNDLAVFVARNLPTIFDQVDRVARRHHRKGKLQIVFLSRIARTKNLDYALKVLAMLDAPTRFDIWGPIEDVEYWNECKALIDALPSSIEIHYCGAASHADVGGILAGCDLFFLPTRGENFGHVIAESISVGTPVLLSDRTPWRSLREHGVGWDLPLEGGEAAFAEAIEHARKMVADDPCGWRERVRKFGEGRLMNSALVEANRRIFHWALNA